jgi:RNA polymerase-binding transcription factor DksA
MRLDPSSTNSRETTTERPGRKRARRKEQREENPASHVSSPLMDDIQRTSVEGSESVGRRGLTGIQIQRLQQRLLEERAKAMRAIWVKRADMEDHRARGELDELEWDIRMAERHNEFIVLIEDALRRLRQSPHDFDVSEVSGGRIPYERLELVPWTRRLTEEADPFSFGR